MSLAEQKLAPGLSIGRSPKCMLQTTSLCLKTEIAGLDVLIVVVHMLCPKWPKLVHANIKPRFHIPIEVHDCSIANLFQAYAWIIAKPENMPRFF